MLQKTLYLLAGTVLCFACESVTPPVVDDTVDVADSLSENTSPKLPSSRNFLALFDAMDADTFVVSSVTKNPNSEEFKFKGSSIPSDLARYFDGIQAYGTFDNATDLFAVYQQALGDDHVLLVVRVPGEDWSSRINLFVFDKNEDRLIDSKLEVAEDFEGPMLEVLRESEVQLLPGQSALIVDMTEMTCFAQSDNPNAKLCRDSLKNFVFTVDGGFEMMSGSGSEMIVPNGPQ